MAKTKPIKRKVSKHSQERLASAARRSRGEKRTSGASNPFTGRVQGVGSKQDVRTTPQPGEPRKTPQGRLIQDGSITTAGARGEPGLEAQGLAEPSNFQAAARQQEQVQNTQQFGAIGLTQPDQQLAPAQQPLTTEPVDGTQTSNKIVDSPAFQGSALQDYVESPVTSSLNRLINSAAALSLVSLGRGATAKIAQAAAGKKIGAGGLLNAPKIATNTVTAAKTSTWLSKVASAATNPLAVASGIMGAVGSYPFAGFIKEEALQTLSFGVKTAIDNKDVEGAEAAIQQQAEVLNPDTWTQILNAIPYANVLTQLKGFYEAATTKLKIDAKSIEKLKSKQASKATEDLGASFANTQARTN